MSETHFPLDESKLPFSIPKDAQPREKILESGRIVTVDRIPAKLHGRARRKTRSTGAWRAR